MAKIFISYAREDRSKAQQIASLCEKRGWSVWWDTRLRAGEVWDEVIDRELTAASCVIVLWSRTSISKRWVRVEATDGQERGVLIPALIEDVRPPLAFRLVQAESLIDWLGDASHPGLVRLMAAVGDRLEEDGDQQNSAVAPEPPRSPASQESEEVKRLADFEVFRDIDAPWCPEMVVLPAGTFLMGSPEGKEGSYDYERPQHRVTIGYRLALGRYPVTVGDYRLFAEATNRTHEGGIYIWDGSEWKCDKSKSWREPGFDQEDSHPVVGVNWDDAKAYCAWLAKETSQAYRLPSEAEWEYACRAGTTTLYAFDDEVSERDANFDKNIGHTTEVGSYSANPWGLHDMHGNVWEWVEDVWHNNYEGAPNDGSAWLRQTGENSARVLRGGSWFDVPGILRSADRSGNQPELRVNYIGFRLSRTLTS